MNTLREYFGNKQQFLTSEIDLLLDLKKLTSSRKKIELEQFLQVEQWIEEANVIDYIDLLQELKLEDNSEQLHKIFGFNKHLIEEWINILLRKTPKKRTLVFYGVSNSGKSLIANALLHIFAPGQIQRDGGTNVHWLEHIYRKNFILWEEPSIHLTNIEDVKLLLGGERIVINRKNLNLIERTEGPAVIVTTNKRFWNYEREALENRCNIYEFNRRDIIPTNTKQIIKYIIDVYKGRFNNIE